MIASATVRTNVIQDSPFTSFEFSYMLKRMIFNLYHMVPFSFKDLILYTQNCDINHRDFFKGHEILGGMSLCDIFLKNPTIIAKAVVQDKELLSQTADQTNIE